MLLAKLITHSSGFFSASEANSNNVQSSARSPAQRLEEE
jgi:hypothetical protein